MQPASSGDEPNHRQQQSPWAPMQYPAAAAAAAAAAMAMQQQMMPPHPQFAAAHLVRYNQHPRHHHHQQQQSGSEENKTIWIGDLHYWMDENYLHNCFAHTGEVMSIKVIRNKQTRQSEGYGFVEFCSHATAEKVLQSFSGHAMPNTDQAFRLNWASFSMGDRRTDGASDYSIFVGDLAPDVTDNLLQETFASKYSSVKGAKVVIDSSTGRSKGYGFVRFGNDKERTLAMTEMSGVYCSSRPMRIGAATPRKSGGFGSNGSSAQGSQSDEDSTNTTVFVGGLDLNVSEDELKEAFSQFGEVASVKIPSGKQCGFVQFVQRSNAEDALQGLNGTQIGKQIVRLSWGRNSGSKQLRADSGSPWNGGVYYGGHMYNGYGFPVPPHIPSMYTAAYGAYPVYGNQQVS